MIAIAVGTSSRARRSRSIHDVKHDRYVAIKVLEPELGAVLGVERFLSEIKVTGNLQHPNLLPLFYVTDETSALDGGDRMGRLDAVP